MSYVGHRCAGCRHRRGEHQNHSNGAPTSCHQTYACSCKGYVDSTPELIPTFTLTGKEAETITVPGEAITPGLKSCDCDDCKALHAQLTAV